MIWTPEQVEARLIEWAHVRRIEPDREYGWLYDSGTYWPEIKRDDLEVWVNALDKAGRHEDMEEPRVPSTPEEISRADASGMWLLFLPDIGDRRIVTSVVVWKMFNPRKERIAWDEIRFHRDVRGGSRLLRRNYKNALEWIALALVCKTSEMRMSKKCA